MPSDLLIVVEVVPFGNRFLLHPAAVHSLFPRFTILFSPAGLPCETSDSGLSSAPWTILVVHTYLRNVNEAHHDRISSVSIPDVYNTRETVAMRLAPCLPRHVIVDFLSIVLS